MYLTSALLLGDSLLIGLLSLLAKLLLDSLDLIPRPGIEFITEVSDDPAPDLEVPESSQSFLLD